MDMNRLKQLSGIKEEISNHEELKNSLFQLLDKSWNNIRSIEIFSSENTPSGWNIEDDETLFLVTAESLDATDLGSNVSKLGFSPAIWVAAKGNNAQIGFFI